MKHAWGDKKLIQIFIQKSEGNKLIGINGRRLKGNTMHFYGVLDHGQE
jgi:hypothetical protein